MVVMRYNEEDYHVPCHTCALREYHLTAGEVHVACEAYEEGIPAEIVTGDTECPHRKAII